MIKEFKTATHEEWLALRKNYIGGSDAAAVVGMNPFSSAYALWAEKTGRVPGFEGNLATDVGTFLEEFVAKKFTERTGLKVRRNNRSLVNDKYPFAIANIDREIVGEDAGLEIKTTSALNLKSFKHGEYPANYYVQCMHYLAVTGKQRWYLAVLIGNKDFNIYTIDRDEDEIKALMDAEREFWALVESDTPPAPDGSESATEAVAEVNKTCDNDLTIDISAYDSDLAELMHVKGTIKDLKDRQTEIENKVKAYLGEAGAGESVKYKVTWKESSTSRFDAKEFAKAHPDLEDEINKYYKNTTSRTFRVRES